jgi:hypothetical protein
MLRRIFGHIRDENGQWRRLHEEEFHRLYHLPYIVRVIKSRAWAVHVAIMEEGRRALKEERDLQESLGINGRTILQWILKK